MVTLKYRWRLAYVSYKSQNLSQKHLIRPLKLSRRFQKELSLPRREMGIVALGCTRLRLVSHAAELQFAERIERNGQRLEAVMKSNKSAVVISQKLTR
jgi:hypothetical protein